ncbi:helix-turn-helix transcriptional regulator [Dokdonella sp.]|uniref:helix-turn-helix transcriptional regulator n=1 Tax=Dokdonella sp. TaxID=2291710 RepID=UPI002608D4EE|nr:helix-turn-helix transcriptional regulator [Dokdonella sp.]
MSAAHRARQHAIARLHEMACLDISGPQLVVPVLRELRHIVAFDSGGYFHPGDDGVPDGYVENPALLAVMPDYFDAHVQRSEGLVLSRRLDNFSETVARYQRRPWVLEPGQLLKVSRAELYRSDYYEAIMRPADLSTWAVLALCTPQGRGLGKLMLFRHTGAPPFTPDELATLASLDACLARVLQPGEPDAGDDGIQASGLLVVTPEGRLLWTSPETERLLPLAFGWRWRGAGTRGPLPHAVQWVLQRLQWTRQHTQPGTRRGESGTALPQMQWHNTNGTFSLRATRLSAAGGQGEAVALHLTQRVALGTRLLAALQPLPLSRRQRELAYWIARGCSESQIVARMGISTPTLVYHRRALYERLQVQDRRGLLARLSPPTQRG